MENVKNIIKVRKNEVIEIMERHFEGQFVIPKAQVSEYAICALMELFPIDGRLPLLVKYRIRMQFDIRSYIQDVVSVYLNYRYPKG